ncbi:MAG: Tyrosine recombinase XerD [Candidatus Hydrogenedentes bacterium ADurb.Bin170]|jgi:integrase/recombinase XerD|nr:MAG: Tyrosine recombinase XerD [Candidatus Hydrogenedentes bacterium ADurb.Bin170]
MSKRVLDPESIFKFEAYLREEEKSECTISKYLRDARAFLSYADKQTITKELVIGYKQTLIDCGDYEVGSINSMLVSINALLKFLGWSDCTVKCLKTQHKIYCAEEKELNKAEYERLLNAAEGQPRLQLILKTICSTGIRVSELQYFTVEGVKSGEITVECKNKLRTVIIPKQLKPLLLAYAKKCGIESGIIFCTRSGKPINRSNIWAAMKALCEAAHVNPSKVFPHNLRKLFARTFYKIEKDIAKLADILGHSSIDTTRIYLISSGREHRERIDRLGLCG